MADSKPGDGGFLSRWSQRKAQARTSAVADESSKKNEQKNGITATISEADNSLVKSTNDLKISDNNQKIDISEKPASTGPTLEDVAKLTADSDYSVFAAKSVDPQVRNAAMRKLFAGDPHFNVMDRLDVYIDDYSVGEPIPQSMLRQMVQARSLGLLDDDLVDQDKPSPADVPETLAANDTAPLHENADLQLQRDDTAGHTNADARVEPPTTFDIDPGFKPELESEPGQPRAD